MNRVFSNEKEEEFVSSWRVFKLSRYYVDDCINATLKQVREGDFVDVRKHVLHMVSEM